MATPHICGVYRIKNTLNGNIYIGSSANMEYRFYIHLYRLRRGIHCNQHLQSAFDKYGENYFVMDVIKSCKPDELIELEQFYIDTLKPEYNIYPLAYRSTGHTISEAGKAKISAANKGKCRRVDFHHTEETKRILSEASKGNKNMLGHCQSEETKRKISSANLNRKHTPESRLNVSIAVTEWWRNRKEKQNAE
jgi:group I intron endonuclease